MQEGAIALTREERADGFGAELSELMNRYRMVFVVEWQGDEDYVSFEPAEDYDENFEKIEPHSKH